MSIPRWSPDSEFLIFDSQNQGANSALYTVSKLNDEPVRVSDSKFDEINGSWSANGQWIYFTSNRSGQWQIWKMTKNGDQLTQITDNGGFYGIEGPDGKFFFYSKHRTNGIWRRSTTSTQTKEELIIQDVSVFDWANWVVTAEGIFFVNRQPTNHLEFYDFSSGQIQMMSDTTKSVRFFGSSSITVSSDGKMVYYSRPDSWVSDIMMATWK